MKIPLIATLTLILILPPLVMSAGETGKPAPPKDDDKLILHQVTGNVYGIEGPLRDRTARNLGNNATFGFVVTTKGVVVVDPGGTNKGAKRIHEIIRSVTGKPVMFVINTGGQDHRWLGNDYFKKQGATVIASAEAVRDQKGLCRKMACYGKRMIR